MCNNKAITIIATTIHQIQTQLLQNKNKKSMNVKETRGQYGRHAYNKQTRAKTEADSKNLLCVTGGAEEGATLMW